MNAAERVRLMAATVVLTVVAGCGLTGGNDEKAAVPVAATPAVEVTEEPLAAAEDPTAQPTTQPTTKAPSPKPSKTSKKPKPSRTSATPTEEPLWDQAPDCADHVGKAVSKAKVKAALKKAAGRTYWRTEAPGLKLNTTLVRAVAWQESGWQSNIKNCDGGFGVMQVMPDTLEHVNQRFGLDYDSTGNYRDNAYAGANYLAWLTKYYGDQYFKGSYNLSASKCKSHSSWCLLNLVVSGYNAGYGTVDEAADSRDLPNPGYVDSVRSLMADCPCDRY